MEDYVVAPLIEPLSSVVNAGAPRWLMITLGLLMFGGWTAVYVETIRKSFRDKAYGIPVPNTCLNFSWELIFSFNLAGGLPKFFFPLQVGHLLWLLPNAFNVYQTLKFGPGIQKHEWVRRHFYELFVATFVVSFMLIYTYHSYAHDVYGVASSWIINVLMSWLFIRMYLDRRTDVVADGSIRGMSLRAAWFKLVGNAAGALFCYFWWPAQFASGTLVHNGVTVPEPQSWTFLYLLYIVNIALDIALIERLRTHAREQRLQPRPAVLTAAAT